MSNIQTARVASGGAVSPDEILYRPKTQSSSRNGLSSGTCARLATVASTGFAGGACSVVTCAPACKMNSARKNYRLIFRDLCTLPAPRPTRDGRIPASRGFCSLLAVALFIFVFFILGGCATPQTDRIRATASALPRPVELTDVPFFPQEEYQCGPAALATVLNAAGAIVTPAELTPEVYLPKRKGSLQLELIGAARRQGRIPYVLRPELESVFAEVDAGNPVLVLQNLSFWWYPEWHYAVVVGFDLPGDRIVLRSGREKRHVIPIEVFERTWRRGRYWAMVVLPPERLPFTAEEIPYLQSVAVLERLSRWETTQTAYGAALTRWPKSLVARMGLGNSRYALGDVPGAEQAFRQATRDHPDAAVAFNNLAQVLAEENRWQEALTAAQRAVNLGGAQAQIFRETLKQIETQRKLRQEPLGPP